MNLFMGVGRWDSEKERGPLSSVSQYSTIPPLLYTGHVGACIFHAP